MDSLVRMIASLVGAGLLYIGWLALVLSIVSRPASPAPLGILLTAPVATAFGFGLGTLIGDRFTPRPRMRMPEAFLWPLAGCIAGTLVVYPFGPMLIVFGMFSLGIAAVVANEVIERRKTRLSDSGIQKADSSRS